MLLKKNIPFKYVFGKIKYEILCIALYCMSIAVVYYLYPSIRITIPLAIPAVLGTVISLLLGFRSNQAYDRWWEARHIWGAVVNDSRTLVRQILSFTGGADADEDVKALRKKIVQRQIAWCYGLGRHLRNENPLTGLEKYLDREEMVDARVVDNVPSALLHEMGKDLSVALSNRWINGYQQVELDKTLSRLCDSMGKCERIKNTVFPITYSLYIHLSLLLFIGLLPFGVIEYFGFVEIPLVVTIAACFLLIEKMAIHLQDPFENKPTDTPMTHIAQGIEKNLSQLYKAHESRNLLQQLYEADNSVYVMADKQQRQIKETEDRLYSYWGTSAEKRYFIL